MKPNEVAHRLGITTSDLHCLHIDRKAPLGFNVGGMRFYRRAIVDEWAKNSGRETPNDWREIDA